MSFLSLRIALTLLGAPQSSDAGAHRGGAKKKSPDSIGDTDTNRVF